MPLGGSLVALNEIASMLLYFPTHVVHAISQNHSTNFDHFFSQKIASGHNSRSEYLIYFRFRYQFIADFVVFYDPFCAVINIEIIIDRNIKFSG